MSVVEDGGLSQKPSTTSSSSTGSYVLRPLLQDIPLSTDEHTTEAQITCVELSGQSSHGLFALIANEEVLTRA